MPLRMSSMSIYSSSGTLNIVPRMDALGTSFLLRFIFLESEIFFFHPFCKACEITWLMQPRRAWKFSRNHYFASHVKDMSSAQRKWTPNSRGILEFFPVSCLSYSTVLLNCIREHPHGVVHRDYFLYGLLPVFAISEGGDKDQSLKSNQAFEAKV